MEDKHEELIAGYLNGSLTDEEKQLLEELIADGTVDFMEFRETEELYEELEMIPAAAPGESVRENFYSMLHTEMDKEKKSPANMLNATIRNIRESFTMPQLAYAAVFLIMGGFIGSFINPGQSEIEQLSAEMKEMRQMMLVSMLEGPSATDRLKAVNISTQMSSVDDQAVQALLFTLNNDRSVNVRVQAIEALKQWGNNEMVRKGLVRSISRQESPIVIVELADTMIELELKNSADEFRRLMDERQLDVTVQTKLKNSIAALI